MTSQPEQRSESNSTPPRRRKRRFLRRVLILIVIVVVLIAVAPSLLSTGGGTRWLSNTISRRSDQNIQMEKLRLRWWGGCELTNLQVAEAGGAELCRIESITLSRGLAHLLTNWRQFGSIVVQAPQITVREQTSLDDDEDDEDDKDDQKPREAQPWSNLSGSITISNGRVNLQKPDGRSYQISELSGKIDLDTLNRIDGRIDLRTDGGGRITGQVELTDAFDREQFNLDTLRGAVTLRSEETVDMGPLLSWLTDEADAGGAADVELKASFAADGGAMTFTSKVTGLTVGTAAPDIKPIDVTIDGKGEMAGERFATTLDISSAVGQWRGDIEGPTTIELKTVTWDQLLALLLNGGECPVPDIHVNGSGSIDLKQLAAAAPGLLRPAEGIDITAGRVEVAQLNFRGGAAPALQSRFTVNDLAVRQAGESIVWQPITGAMDLAHDVKKGMNVNQAQVRAAFLQLQVTGAAGSYQGDLAADAGQLMTRLKQLGLSPAYDLAGRVQGDFTFSGVGRDEISVVSNWTVEQFAYAYETQKLDLDRVSVESRERLQFEQEHLKQVAFDTVNVTVNDDDLRATAVGTLDLSQQRLRADVNVSRARVGALRQWAQDLNTELEMEEVDGVAEFDLDIDLSLADKSVSSQGTARVGQLAAQGRALTLPDGSAMFVQADWTALQLAPEKKTYALQKLLVTSPAARFTAVDLACAVNDQRHTAGDIEFNADLALCHHLRSIIHPQDESAHVSGQLNWRGSASVAGDDILCKGAATVTDLHVISDRGPYREAKITSQQDVAYNPTTKTARISNLEIDSQALALKATGTAAQLPSPCILDIKGSYRADWESLTRLLHSFAPETRDTVALAGRSTSDFAVSGPANDPELQPAFLKLTADTAVSWPSGQFSSAPLGAGELRPRLHNGQLELPLSAFDVADGKARLAGRVDFRPEEPTLYVGESLVVLEDVPVKRPFALRYLSRFNPIFGDLANIEGRAGLDMDSFVMPLGPSRTSDARGGGTLKLSQLQMKSAGLLGQILRLGGLVSQDLVPVRMSDLDFTVEKSRLHYEDMALYFPGNVDIHFSGSVGFDDSVDLVVSLPVAAPLLKTLGLGKTDKVTKALAGKRIDIPITGTRMAPVLDLERFSIGAAQWVPGLILDVLLGDESGPTTPSEPQEPAGEQAPAPETPAEQKPADTISDILFDILKESQKKRDGR